MSLTACVGLKRPDKVCTRQHDNVGLGAIQGAAAGNEGLDACPSFPPPTIQPRTGRTSAIVKRWNMKWESGENSLSLHVSFFLFFFDMQRSCPIFTVKLFQELQCEASVMTAIQFPYEQLPRRQGWQFIYFNLSDWENHAHQSSQPSHCIQGTRHRRAIDGPGPFQWDPAALA